MEITWSEECLLMREHLLHIKIDLQQLKTYLNKVQIMESLKSYAFKIMWKKHLTFLIPWVVEVVHPQFYRNPCIIQYFQLLCFSSSPFYTFPASLTDQTCWPLLLQEWGAVLVAFFLKNYYSLVIVKRFLRDNSSINAYQCLFFLMQGKSILQHNVGHNKLIFCHLLELPCSRF